MRILDYEKLPPSAAYWKAQARHWRLLAAIGWGAFTVLVIITVIRGVV